MLFRPIGQQTFAGALGLLKSRGIATDRAIAHLCQAPMQLSEPPWLQVMWNPNTKRMINANKPLAEALFLHMVDEPPRSRRFDLRENYQRVYGLDLAPLDDLPVHPIRPA